MTLQCRICLLSCVFKDSKELRTELAPPNTLQCVQIEELHGLLRPHLLRRLKTDVLVSLPPKKEQIVRVELAAPQRALYKSLLTNSYKTLISGAQI